MLSKDYSIRVIIPVPRKDLIYACRTRIAEQLSLYQQ